MDWACILTQVTGTVDQELLARNEYLAAENRIMIVQLKGRLRLSDAERGALGEIGHRLGRKALAAVTAAARPETILGRSSPTQLMAGRNYDLAGLRMVIRILMPAAFPLILTGLKIGWALAWRALIAAELVFGVSGNSAVLGWYFLEARNALETAHVFAGLLTLILIGLIVEGLVFQTVEALTIQKWGMQNQ